MTYANSWNPGAPYGARWDDAGMDDPVRVAGINRTTGHLPWDRSTNPSCPDCPRTKGGCRQHAIPGKPRVRIPGGPGPNDDLPCVGRWDLFDRDHVTDEARTLCASCPFAEWCLATAIENNEQVIWAASTYGDRRAWRKREAA